MLCSTLFENVFQYFNLKILYIYICYIYNLEAELLDFSSLSAHQTKTLEMEAQVHLLKLEREVSFPEFLNIDLNVKFLLRQTD